MTAVESPIAVLARHAQLTPSSQIGLDHRDGRWLYRSAVRRVAGDDVALHEVEEARAQIEAAAAETTQQTALCPSCGGPINPATAECRCSD